MSENGIPIPPSISENEEDIYLLGFLDACELMNEETYRLSDMTERQMEDDPTAFHNDEAEYCPECGEAMRWNPPAAEYICMNNHE